MYSHPCRALTAAVVGARSSAARSVGRSTGFGTSLAMPAAMHRSLSPATMCAARRVAVGDEHALAAEPPVRRGGGLGLERVARPAEAPRRRGVSHQVPSICLDCLAKLKPHRGGIARMCTAEGHTRKGRRGLYERLGLPWPPHRHDSMWTLPLGVAELQPSSRR